MNERLDGLVNVMTNVKMNELEKRVMSERTNRWTDEWIDTAIDE